MPAVYVTFQLIFFRGKCDGKVVFVSTVKVYGGSRNIVPVILNPDTSWTEWLGLHAERFTLGEIAPVSTLTGGCFC
jgi:hypothetical protein